METSGLFGESKPKGEPETRITCIGLMDDYGIRQFASPWESWNTDPDRAELMLLKFFVDSRALKRDEEVLTYNGTTFDFPLLRQRLEVHALKENFDDILHIDQMPFVTALNGYRVRKESAASKYADIYTPKTTEAAYFARSYMYKLVTPQIQSKMLAHNAMDVATTWSFHHDMMRFPDYRGFVEETVASRALAKDAAGLRAAAEKKMEDATAFL